MISRLHFDVAIPLLTFNPSGGVRMLVHAANEVASRGHRVVFTAPAGAPPPVNLHTRVAIQWRRRRGGFMNRYAFADTLPDAHIYIASGYQTPGLIWLGAALNENSRLLYLIQNDEPASHVRHGAHPAWLKPLLGAVASLGYRVPARRIAVSSFVAGRVGRARVHRVIHPGIDPLFMESAPRVTRAGDRLTVGILTHPGIVKGMAVALAAFATLDDDPRLRFVAFDGDHPAPLPAHVEPFSSFARRTHVSHDILTFYDACDVFVFPSLVEGFGLPPLEAMARRCAVVVTDCGGPREYAEENNCVMVPPGDARALADAIHCLAGDAALRELLAAKGRQAAARFPVDAFARGVADEVDLLLADETSKTG